MRQLRKQDRLVLFLRSCGVGAFVGYMVWNGYWLANGRLPPSIWTSVTGLPCPTSGVTRSIKALIAGDGVGFILYNAFTVPFVAMVVHSGYRLAAAGASQKRAVLSRRLGLLWLAVLLAAWLSKFLVGPKYW